MGGVCPDQMKNEAGLDSESILYHLDQPCISLVGIGTDYDFNLATGNKLDEDNPRIPVNLENVFTHPLSWKVIGLVQYIALMQTLKKTKIILRLIWNQVLFH